MKLRNTAIAGIIVSLLMAFSASPTFAHPVQDEGEAAVQAARTVLGADYKWGGTGPAFDCSGLVAWSYRRAGVTDLPRTSLGLHKHTRSISKSELRPGDLVFWSYGSRNGVGNADHVALYVGDGAVIGSRPSRGGVTQIELDSLWTPPMGYGRIP